LCAQEHGIKPTARLFDTSPKTVRKWLRRWKEQGWEGLSDHGRAPKKPFRRITPEDEFYEVEHFSSRTDFLHKASSYILWFNVARKNSYKNHQTPWQIIHLRDPTVSPDIVNLPPVFPDELLIQHIDKKKTRGYDVIPYPYLSTLDYKKKVYLRTTPTKCEEWSRMKFADLRLKYAKIRGDCEISIPVSLCPSGSSALLDEVND
ncbi:MAG: helix-turn-helix domain-containing protein, partial [Deltaproteobacteria bacterium]|nr:helix-turn-helix domain-containing protein [Deltaproteobacteria bacterium]